MAEQRAAELARKRAKLAEMRKAREQQQSGSTSSLAAASKTKSVADVDALVASIVGPAATAESTRTAPTTPSIPVSITPSSSVQSAFGMASIPTVSANATPEPSVVADYKPKLLESQESILIDLVPKTRVVYSKDCQTEPEFVPESPVEVLPPAPVPVVTLPKAVTVQIVPELSENERERLLTSDSFLEFFDTSTKLVERALNERYDYLIDYARDEHDANESKSSESLVSVCSFADESRWTKQRCVTSLDWSHKYPELLVASYGRSSASFSDDPDGLVLVWNHHLKERPEFIFHASSDILKVMVAPHQPQLLLGACYNGQLCVWDTRTRRGSPVLRSPRSASGGHAHPVYAFGCTGTSHQHAQMVSVSTDGLLCVWQMDMLARPTLSLPLVNALDEPVAATCIAFHSGDVTQFLVGSERGPIYSGSLVDRSDGKAGLIRVAAQHAESSPVIALQWSTSDSFSLSSGATLASVGYDWTVRLWTYENATSPFQSKFVYDSNDYVMDLAWHPRQSSLLATVNASGICDLYRPDQDRTAPVASVEHTHGLNTLSWSRDESSSLLAAGDVQGHIQVWRPNSQTLS